MLPCQLTPFFSVVYDWNVLAVTTSNHRSCKSSQIITLTKLLNHVISCRLHAPLLCVFFERHNFSFFFFFSICLQLTVLMSLFCYCFQWQASLTFTALTVFLPHALLMLMWLSESRALSLSLCCLVANSSRTPQRKTVSRDRKCLQISSGGCNIDKRGDRNVFWTLCPVFI